MRRRRAAGARLRGVPNMSGFRGSFPPLAGETMMSWLGRLARTACGFSPFEFLNLIGLSRSEILEANPSAIERLADVTGMPREAIERGVYLRIGERFYEHRGERFHAEFAGRDRTTFCPACLLDNCQPGSPSAGRRVGRVNWLFEPVRTCPVHGIPLLRRVCGTYAERFQDMELVAPDDATLRQLADAALPQAVSPLQTYVERRFEGCSGPEWLDGQAVDQAARTCEVLGAVLLHGSHVELPDLSQNQWDAAGAEGFAFAAQGERGVRDALDILLDRFRLGVVAGGPQAAFGRLYQWLQFNRGSKDRGPIRSVLREHILETMAVEPGTRLLGTVVEVRRRHSIASLSRASGIHPKTLNRALVQSGLIPGGDPNRVDGHLSVEGEAGERLAERIKRSIPVVRIPAYLNCNRTQAQMLVGCGLVGRIRPAEPGSKTMLNMVRIDDLDAFLARLHAGARAVVHPSDGMTDIVQAAMISRWPVVDIVNLVLEGGLRRVEAVASERGFKAMHVDPEEVRHLLDTRQAGGRLSLHEAADRLGLPPTGIRALMTERDRDGLPFLQAAICRNGHGSERPYFELAELDHFATAHVDFGTIAAERGVTLKELGKALPEANVAPILPRAKLNKLVYRRSDV
jgi:hypothetical protein